MRSIYFDYNATTPLDPMVREAMLPYLDRTFGNPSSVHHVGRLARVALDEARDRVAHVFGCKPSEIVFTSGGTESNNLAIFGIARLRRQGGRHLITSSVEHHAVLHACEYLEKREGFEVTYLPVDAQGRVAVESVERAVRPGTVLVSVMAANNETGAVQPVSEIGALCRSKGILFHTDAVQCFGKEPFRAIDQFNADLVSVCGHKLYGPKGVGALYIKSPLHPDPILFGGGHENDRRAGTENLAAIIGFTEALERFTHEPVFPRPRLTSFCSSLMAACQTIPGLELRGPLSHRLCNTVSFTFEGCDSISLLAALDMAGVCASSGAACSAGSLEPSHVLRAMGVPLALANSFVRFSLGRESTAAEVQYVSEVLPGLVQRIRSHKLG